MSTCPKCGSPIDASSSASCALCGTILPSTSYQSTQTAQPLSANPWESIPALGVFPALYKTIIDSMLKPSLFYENISAKSSKRLAFVYAIILGSIGSIIGLIWTSFLVSALLPVFPQLEEFSELLTPSGASLIMMPLITTAQIFLVTFYFHTLLAITNTPRKSVGTTFCVVCYAQSTAVLSLIPVVGSIAAIVWSLFMMTIGFNKVHRITMIRSIIINLLPLLILGFIGILLAVGIAVVSALFN